MNVQIVGVVGAGVMGQGVSQNLVQTGHQVILLDVSNEILERAQQEILNSIRFQEFFNKGEQMEAPDVVLKRIQFSTNYELLKDTAYVIENVTEKWAIKEDVYRRMDVICPVHCIFASNTSAIPITRIASVTERPQKVIGIHFMNPVPMKLMVEVIRGYHTSNETLQTTKDLLAKMGKEYIVVNDSPGFVSNRVLMLTINEAVCLIQEQVASVEEVDEIFKTCFGHQMGPLETADLIGLDTILLSVEVLYESFNDSKYRPCPLLKKMVDAGLHGRKTGRGFYTYQ